MIPFHNRSAIDGLARELRIDPQAVRKARTTFFKKSAGANAALACLPEQARSAFEQAVSFHSLTTIQRFDSQTDNASKLISHTNAGFAIETVLLRPQTGRLALCVSSQVGCAAACAFCATGHMGVAHSLTADEILDQVVVANELVRDEGRRVRNLVFMGMGEPMHNEAAVAEALEALQDPALFDHPPSRVLVSTVGVPEVLVRMGRRFPRTNFALSLHSAEQSVREQIMPLARRYDLSQLRDAIVELNAHQAPKTGVMIEHLMLDGLNDSPEAADLLLDWLDGLRVHVNLIPFNPIDQAPNLRSSSREVIERFGSRLRAAGQETTIRYSLGRDIDAACGQLVQDENREVARRLATQSART